VAPWSPGLRGPLAACPDSQRLVSDSCSSARGLCATLLSAIALRFITLRFASSLRPAHTEDFHLQVTRQCWAHNEKGPSPFEPGFSPNVVVNYFLTFAFLARDADP